jgi:hypothetical protein
MALAFALAHCAWVAGFESSYTVEATAADGGGGDGSSGGPGGDGSLLDAAIGSDASASFGDAILVASGETTPIGGIAVDSQAIYWTIALADAGVRSAGKDGGAVTDVAQAVTGTYQEIIALPGDTLYWRVSEATCGTDIGCGRKGTGYYGICGLATRKLRTDGRRFYLLAQELNTGKFPINVVSKGCGGMATITRLDSEAGAGSPYVNITPDLSGNRVFAVAGTSVDCLAVAGGPTVHVADGNILDLVSDDAHLYWLTPSELHRCTLGSDTACAPCKDDEIVTKTSSGIVPALVLDGPSLYWTAPSGISRIARDAPAGTPATTVVTNQPSPVALAVDATGIYWANGGDGSIMRAPRK